MTVKIFPCATAKSDIWKKQVLGARWNQNGTLLT